MPARQVECRVLETIWITPTVLRLRFEPSRKFDFEPGQFLSLVVPKPFSPPGASARLKRIYSLAAPKSEGYELCVKQTRGPGPSYLASLKAGDSFKVSAPYGDFFFQPAPERSVCFVSTGTGIAPFRAMVLSKFFQENRPSRAISLFGAREESEILYRGEFEQAGVEEAYALSAPAETWQGFRGRVTDWFKQQPEDWGWDLTDFYLCGNGAMVAEVRRILRDLKGVPASAIRQEVYFKAPRPT